jgi:hypothetical protein
LRCFDAQEHDMDEVTIVAPTARMGQRIRLLGIDVAIAMPLLHHLQWGTLVNASYSRKSDRQFQFLIPGSVNFSKRNYDQLTTIKVEPGKLHFNIFGKCLCVSSCRRLRAIAHKLLQKGITVEHSSNYTPQNYAKFTHLADMLQRSDYIFPAIDGTVPFSEDYSAQGKLSASIALAFMAEKPLLVWCALKQIYSLRDQLCYNHSRDISHVFNNAMTVSENSYGLFKEELHQAKTMSISTAINEVSCKIRMLQARRKSTASA